MSVGSCAGLCFAVQLPYILKAAVSTVVQLLQEHCLLYKLFQDRVQQWRAAAMSMRTEKEMRGNWKLFSIYDLFLTSPCSHSLITVRL